MKLTVSNRTRSARIKGRLGGLQTARNSSQEFLETRASKGGISTSTKYGTGFYSYLRNLRPRKTTKEKIQEVVKSVIPTRQDNNKELTSLELIQEASKLIRYE